jgi:predicted PolB exonuclease-like 3'-5' exonuclease
LSNIDSIRHLLFIDIETVPLHSHCNNLAPEHRQLFFDKLSKNMPESYDEEQLYRQKAGILAEFGKVVCISVGYVFTDDNKTCLKLKSICDQDEVQLLHNFISLVNKFATAHKSFQFAGHNIREFDIPFLCRRMVINQIPLPPYLHIHGAKPWEVNMVDTLQWWKFGDYKNYTSLNLLAHVLGIPTSKDDINGSMVQDVYYKEKNLQRIVEYCQKDVVVVAQVVLRFKNQPLILPENICISD